ncbi:hypothetical protein EYF80_002549 [Liparis tanakae]|uniref:Uncharacterized protein n=1 Tax=Liparis tanakae TaxID=230148 RepID=A0A4Z2JCK9_9TELE|nr:hypothetical protein EYF80_002549 [Liparis tanakae]
MSPGHDLLTSRCDPGGRGLVLAALRHRSHSAPHRREVKVQLLDPGPLSTRVQERGARPTSCCLEDAAPLVESELLTGHTPVTSDLTAPHPQCPHLETTAGIHSNQQPIRTASIASETGPVAMATPCDQWPEHTR